MGRQTTEGGGHWLARCRLSLPSGLPSTQPSAQCGAGWGGRGSLSGDKWQTTLTGAVGQTPGGTWPRWLPQPRLLLGMGWLWGPRGREHPGAHALLWCRGQLGLERPWSMNTEPRGPGRGHGPGAELSAAPGQRLQGRLLQLVGNPSGSGRTDPREQAEAWPWPCAQQLPRTAPGPWVAGQSGLPPVGGQGPWVVEAGRSRSLLPLLAAVACFQAAADWSPVASTTPTPNSGPEGLPSTRGAFTGNGPAPWALSPGSPLGDHPASKTPEEARPGQCAKNQHLCS